MAMLYWLTNTLIIAYVYATITFLLLRIFIKTMKVKTTEFLNIANAILLLLLAVNLAETFIDVFECSSTRAQMVKETKPEGYNFYYQHNCYSVLVWTLLLAFSFQLVFLYKRFREKVFLTISSILLLLIFFKIEYLIIFITALNRNYLPTSWVIETNELDKWWELAASVIYFAACWYIPMFKLKKKDTTF